MVDHPFLGLIIFNILSFYLEGGSSRSCVSDDYGPMKLVSFKFMMTLLDSRTFKESLKLILYKALKPSCDLKKYFILLFLGFEEGNKELEVVLLFQYYSPPFF